MRRPEQTQLKLTNPQNFTKDSGEVHHSRNKLYPEFTAPAVPCQTPHHVLDKRNGFWSLFWEDDLGTVTRSQLAPSANSRIRQFETSVVSVRRIRFRFF